MSHSFNINRNLFNNKNNNNNKNHYNLTNKNLNNKTIITTKNKNNLKLDDISFNASKEQEIIATTPGLMENSLINGIKNMESIFKEKYSEREDLNLSQTMTTTQSDCNLNNISLDIDNINNKTIYEENNNRFKLFGVIYLVNGKYVSFCFVEDGWFKFKDDEVVKENPELNSKDVYSLFYMKI
jgi:hypothetical protein